MFSHLFGLLLVMLGILVIAAAALVYLNPVTSAIVMMAVAAYLIVRRPNVR